ncbi:MAG: restriction endonuclease [Acidobacteriia bacterium]|nr:restriction endonuclease [Terriglobia bacterium]
MKNPAAFERQVRRIYELIAESGAEVTWNDHISDPDNPPRTRQIDVTIRRNSSLTLVECRLRKTPQDVQWIECLIGRRISLGAQSVIAVSSSGFTAGALAKARQYGIITRDLQRLSDKEVENWGKRIELRLYYYQYSDLGVSLRFSPESIQTIKLDSLRAERRWHSCLQSLFNAAAQKLTDANLLSGRLDGQKVKFGVEVVFDEVHLCGVPLERASLTGSAELVAIEADAPVVHAYGEPNTSSTQREAVVQDFQSIGHTSITQSADRISTLIDLSQVEIPPFGHFRFVRVNTEEELDHDAFEIFGIEEKLKVVVTGLRVKVYSSSDAAAERG